MPRAPTGPRRPEPGAPLTPAHALARAAGPAVRGLDALLVRAYGLRSVDGEGPGCRGQGLRIRRRALRHTLVLHGTTLPAGTPSVELHLCNERALEPGTREGAARRATRLLVRYRRSCRAVARLLRDDPAFADARALGGVTALFGGAGGHGGAARLPRHLGFEVLPHRPRGGGLGLFFERCYAWCLLAAFTPGSLQGRRFGDLAFIEVWMTREDFLARFGPAG